jgi:hypothetical protein
MADVPTVGSVSFSQMRGSTNNTGQGVSLGSLNLHNLNTPQRLGQIATSQTLGTSKRTPPLFSPSSQQGMVGLYSMKLANPYYTGPVIRAQRSLDNSTLDFWADADGALMSATGNTFASWINSDDLTINYTVTNSGAGAYLINGASNPTLTVIRGLTYTFTVNASGHPFWIQTTVGAYNAGTVYSTGVTNAGTQVGIVTWKVSNDAPSTLYYVCQNHSAMNGTINVINKVQQVTANLLTWYDQSQNDMEALKYPPVSLGGGTANPTTATLTSAPYGNGSYIYSGSTQYNTSEFVGALFNSSGNFQNYTSAGGVDAYNGSTGAFTGSTSTTVSGSAYTGAWVQIQLPYAIYPTSYYRLMSSGRNETSHVFAGSNNGTTWALLNSATEPAYTTSSLINLNVTASYSYYRLIARSINPANQFGFWSLSQLDVYGRQALTSSRNALATTASGGNPPLIVTDPLTSLTPYLVGTATVNHSAPTSNVALVLPGTSGNVMNLGRFFPSRADPSTSNIFVEAWIYLPTGATGFPFTVSDSGSEDMGFLVNYSTSALQFRVWNTAGSGINSDGNGAALASATWYHIAGSFDRTNNRVYGFVNGVVGSTVGVFSGTARARSSSNMTIGAGNSGTFFPFNGYIRDFRMVNGGIVPTATFTPAQAPFAMASPTYAPSMGTTVLALYQQFFANGKYVVYFPNGVATTAAYYGLTFSPQTISGAMIQYRTISNPSTYQTFLAGSTDMSIKYTNNTLLGTNTDFLG